MPEQVIPSNSGEVKAPVENKPMSESDFLSQRIAKLSGTPPPAQPKAEPPKEPVSEPQAAPTESANPSTEGEPKPAEQPKADVLSKDVSELTDEDIRELAEKSKSGLLKRLAELVAKRKYAEERNAALEAALAQKGQQTELPEPKIDNNPYSNIDKVEDLQAKHEEINGLVEFLEDNLDRAADLGANEPAAVINGQELTKIELREHLRQARKARDKFLPAQFKELQARQQRAALEEQFRQTAKKELPWLDGEDNDTRKQFEAMVKDPRLKKLKEAVPEVAPQLEYLIAHAANSMFTRRQIESYASNKPSLTPPANPKVVAAAPERADARTDKALKDVEARFRQTGNPNDFIALRAQQISKRK